MLERLKASGGLQGNVSNNANHRWLGLFRIERSEYFKLFSHRCTEISGLNLLTTRRRIAALPSGLFSYDLPAVFSSFFPDGLKIGAMRQKFRTVGKPFITVSQTAPVSINGVLRDPLSGSLHGARGSQQPGVRARYVPIDLKVSIRFVLNARLIDYPSCPVHGKDDRRSFETVAIIVVEHRSSAATRFGVAPRKELGQSVAGTD
jgi:hypothetical protein